MFVGTQLCMNSPVDPALLQLVQDNVNDLSVEFDQVQEELKNVVQGLKDFRGDLKI